MDADGWDASDAPRTMVAAAGDRVSARKWRLFMTAAVRDARKHHLVPAVADAISLAERYADGLVGPAELQRARIQLTRGWRETELPLLVQSENEVGIAPMHFAASWVCSHYRTLTGDSDRAAGWLREIIGNPFRWVRWEDEWATRIAHTLATAAYAEGRFDTLPVLADALDDAGCDNAELLAHLRGPGPHVRGCWALDVVLGKV